MRFSPKMKLCVLFQGGRFEQETLPRRYDHLILVCKTETQKHIFYANYYSKYGGERPRDGSFTCFCSVLRRYTDHPDFRDKRRVTLPSPLRGGYPVFSGLYLLYRVLPRDTWGVDCRIYCTLRVSERSGGWTKRSMRTHRIFRCGLVFAVTSNVPVCWSIDWLLYVDWFPSHPAVVTWWIDIPEMKIERRKNSSKRGEKTERWNRHEAGWKKLQLG